MADELQQTTSILAPGLPNPARKPRQVFVAYSYKRFPRADYRRVFNDLNAAYLVDFVFADEKITSLHILQKIANYIRESRFGLYDISGWTPNVTLELGLAFGLAERHTSRSIHRRPTLTKCLQTFGDWTGFSMGRTQSSRRARRSSSCRNSHWNRRTMWRTSYAS